MARSEEVRALQQRITDEIFLALGLSKNGRLRRMFGWLFALPTGRFAEAFADADEAVGRGGMSAGCRVLLPKFSVELRQHGAEALPREGPLLIVSNHPGAYDSISLGACVQRPDLKIVAWATPFYRAMTRTHPWFIYASEDPTENMLSLRACIQHLQAGGALLTFGTGKIEPDPAFTGGAEEWIGRWSPSSEIMLRKVPAARLVVAIASGVLLPRFARSPLTRLRRDPIDQRRIGEFTQIITQLVNPAAVRPYVRLSFAAPLGVSELQAAAGERRLLPAIQARAARLLEEHLQGI